ncbi:MAG TPA: MliC family protein [Candidatus Paceibacterota bacterium]|nr:MliC family protein [Candidatus Paceibacterota bacterium]
MSSNTFWTVIAIIIIVIGGYFALTQHFFSPNTTPPPSTTATSTTTVISSVSYSCDAGKTIAAAYSQTNVALALSDGRSLTLPQTMSGSGIRYELTTGTSSDIIFWSEGDNAFMTENASSTYENCIAGTITEGVDGSKTFTDGPKTFSFSYPSDLNVSGAGGGYTADWMVNATTSGMILARIVVPQSYEQGTNFGDAKFTVGTSADPSAVATCLTYNPTGGHATAATTTTLGDTPYTVFHSSDAGAGNYYDTTSYRTLHNSQCYAIEYTIHYANIKNFPKGAVKAFDEAALVSKLDLVARSFAFISQ